MLALLLLLVMMVAVSPVWAAAKPAVVIGVVASVDREADHSLRVAAKGAEGRTIHIDGSTTYMKWETHQPWQQDAHATSAALLAGRCVDVELRPGTAAVARTIRISSEPAGSIYDPCKTRR